MNASPLNRRTIFASALLLLTVLGLAKSLAQTPAPEKTPLEVSMHRISAAVKELSADLKQPTDASKDDYLKQAQIIRDESVKAHDLVPKMAATLPTDQQPAFVAAYQKDMDKFTASIDTLIQQLQAGSWDDARTTLAGLKQQEKDGHHAYRLPEKKDQTAPTTSPAATVPAVIPVTAPAS